MYVLVRVFFMLDKVVNNTTQSAGMNPTLMVVHFNRNLLIYSELRWSLCSEALQVVALPKGH